MDALTHLLTHPLTYIHARTRTGSDVECNCISVGRPAELRGQFVNPVALMCANEHKPNNIMHVNASPTSHIHYSRWSKQKHSCTTTCRHVDLCAYFGITLSAVYFVMVSPLYTDTQLATHLISYGVSLACLAPLTAIARRTKWLRGRLHWLQSAPGRRPEAAVVIGEEIGQSEMILVFYLYSSCDFGR